MSIVAIRALLESRLAVITPALATAFENFPFTPINGTPWQRVNLMAAQPLNPTMGDGFRRDAGIFQVMLFYPENAGPSAAALRSELVCAQFDRGLSLTSGSLRVLVNTSPWASIGRNDGGWYALPVSIPYVADVYPT